MCIVLLPFSPNAIEFDISFALLSAFYPDITEIMLKSQEELAEKLLATATLAEF